MRFVLVFLAMSVLAGGAMASSDGIRFDQGVPLGDARSGFYCQNPDVAWGALSACTAFDSELADDLPDQFSGTVVGPVTLWVCEWQGEWRDPASIILNFYDDACPPQTEGFAHHEIPWSLCTKTLVHSGAWTVYEVTVPINGHMLLTGNSMGASVGNTWGQDPPYCGLCWGRTLSGCGGAWWDGEFWGSYRWDYAAYYTGVDADLAYCLDSQVIGSYDEYGACCIGEQGECRIVESGSRCGQLDGSWLGLWTDCDPNPCAVADVPSFDTPVWHLTRVTWGGIKGSYR
jgi:hypothetical protein